MGSLSKHMQRIKNIEFKEKDDEQIEHDNEIKQQTKRAKRSSKNSQEEDLGISEKELSGLTVPLKPLMSEISDPILEVCFNLNSSLAKFYSKGYIDYKQLIHYSIIHCFENGINDEYVVKMLKLGLTNIKDGGKNLFENNPFM